MKSLLTFYKMDFKRKLLLLETYFYTGLYRMLILIIPKKKIIKFLGKAKEETERKLEQGKIEISKGVHWAIDVVKEHSLWECKCLVQALTAQRLLIKRGVNTTLYLGVKLDSNKDLKAHSWVRAGEYLVTGGSNIGEFKIVGKFRK